MTNISGTQSAAKLQKTLGLWHIIIIGLAYIQPMTLFDTFGLVSEESHYHVPTSYIIALIAILIDIFLRFLEKRLDPSNKTHKKKKHEPQSIN